MPSALTDGKTFRAGEQLRTLLHRQRPLFRARWIPAIFACALLYLSGVPAHAAYRVTVDAPAPLKNLLTEFLDLTRYQDRDDLNTDQLNYMLATVDDQVKKLTATEGYFSPKTTVKVDRAEGATQVYLTVEPGPRTVVTKAEVEVAGEAVTATPSQAARVKRSWRLTEGEPFRQEDWSEAKQNGLQILQQRRYPAARIDNSEALVLADRQQAELNVRYDSGPLFTLGAPEVTGAQRYPSTIIDNVNPLQPGEEYNVERLLEFQRQILKTPYYSNVVVDIDKDPANAKQTPVKVQVTEFPTQRVRGAAGYATDTGARLEGLYTHNNMFGRAWVLDAQARMEQRRQLGSLDLAMPPGDRAYVNSVHTSIERTTLEGIDLRTRRLGVRRARSTDTMDVSYSLEYYSDRLQQLDGTTLPSDVFVQPGTHQALVAGIERTWRRVDNPAFPRKGNIINAQAGVALEHLLSDDSFFRFYGRIRQYYPVGRRDLVLLRGELGAVINRGGNAGVPASLLFRAGGTESVRGYGYQSIGSVRNGTVYPTRYLATGSVEYQHWLTREWGAAVFYDVGTAIDNWSGKQFFHGVGIGARWRSPVGRVNADLAYGIQDRKIRPHLSLGVAF